MHGEGTAYGRDARMDSYRRPYRVPLSEAGAGKLARDAGRGWNNNK